MYSWHGRSGACGRCNLAAESKFIDPSNSCLRIFSKIGSNHSIGEGTAWRSRKGPCRALVTEGVTV